VGSKTQLLNGSLFGGVEVKTQVPASLSMACSICVKAVSSPVRFTILMTLAYSGFILVIPA